MINGITGVPLAELALDFHDGLYGASTGTGYAIRKLEGAEVARLLSEGGRPGDGNLEVRGYGRNRTVGLTPEALGALKEKVGAGVMDAHYKALSQDMRRPKGEIPGVLSVKQIEEYHEDYFPTIGLPSSTYGGSGVPNRIEELIYCGACDPKPG